MTLAEFDLTGDLARPARLTVRDPLVRPQHRAGVAFACATGGVRHHRFTGPRWYDVLSAAGPGFDPARRKGRLRFLSRSRLPTGTTRCCRGPGSIPTSPTLRSCSR